MPSRSVEGEIADLIASIARRVRVAVNRQLEPLGVASSHVRALGTMERSPSPIRMHELADRLRIARRTATGLVDELVERGLALRAPDPADGRGVTVVATVAGRAVLADFVGRRRAVVAELTADLAPDERATLRDLLGRVERAGADRSG